MPFDISVIIPVFNAEHSIKKLVDLIQTELKTVKFEIVLVNDGSKDDSDAQCKALTKQYSNLKYISLRKNFGEFNAVICGLNSAEGKYSVLVDDDFQNPPSEILKLYKKAIEGDFDVVYSYYPVKKHSAFRNFGSILVNNLTSYLLKKPKDLYLSSFKMIKREVVEEIIKFKNPYTYIDGIIFQITDNVGKVEVEHHTRGNGQSNYTFNKLISLFLTILFGFSLLPLRLTLFVGLFSIICSLIYMALYFIDIVPEWGSPVVIFLGGTTLSAIAIIGEYIGKSFMILNGRPQFIIKEKIQSKSAN
jgi:glycosyltransferase involved in cell wall biosynthesis